MLTNLWRVWVGLAVVAHQNEQASAHRTAVAATPSACPVDFSKVRGVLFDIDGTLCNSDPTHFKV
jgi:hypothetical protein